MTLDAEILKALRGAGSGSVSGAALSQQLGVSRAAVWARIEELRRLGYDIAASPHEGYRLVHVPDVLHADDLMTRLAPRRIIGRDIRVFQETTSTSDMADRLGRDGVQEGVVVLAESQTRGRGRLGRRWIATSGRGILFSVLLRPAMDVSCVTQLTVLGATALSRAVRKVTGVEADIKWPNDLLVRGRKLAGILTEMHAELDRVRYAVMGIGLNVNQTERDFSTGLRESATSLHLATGLVWSRGDLVVALLRELEADYERIRKGRFAEIADEWEAACGTIGRQVTVTAGSRQIRGRAEALDSDGAMLVRTQHGRLERVTGGDLTLADA